MPLRLAYRGNTTVPVEIDWLAPDVLRGQATCEVERRAVFHGNEQVPLGELFAASGSADDGQIELAGDLSGVHGIGTRMSAGQIRIDGHAGRRLGSEMRGGTITVDGDAADWVGGEMHGGLIHVRGSAGDFVGAAYRGSPRGMTGGTILVDGRVGHEVGHTMRRGLIAAGGCGDFAGLNMIAGTILVFGPVGDRPGAGMRRGTLGLLGDAPARLLPTFCPGGVDRPLFMRLLLGELARLGLAVDLSLADAAYRTFHGDLVAGGRAGSPAAHLLPWRRRPTAVHAVAVGRPGAAGAGRPPCAVRRGLSHLSRRSGGRRTRGNPAERGCRVTRAACRLAPVPRHGVGNRFNRHAASCLLC